MIASAITDKGIETLSDATFQTMADNIGLIEGGEKSNLPYWCPNFWIEGEPSKVTMGLSSTSINNEIYLIGGRSYDSVSASFCTDVNVYNIKNNIWSKKTTIPTPRCWLTSDVINNKIYSIGGYASTGAINTNECYDPLTNTWSSKTSSPWYVYYHTSSVIDNNIYIIGGYWSDSTSDNYCYDTLTDTWSSKTKTSRKRYQSTSNAIGDKIYCMGGYVNDIYDDNICYDTLTDTWSTKSSMLTATYGLVSEVINNKIYCIGGRTDISTVTLKNAIEVYDVNTDSWKEEGSIKTPRYEFTSEVINGIIYTFCGYTTTSLDITEGYVVAEDIKLGSEEVRSGKELIATAITNKGVTTSSNDSFQTMADNIGLIEGGSNLPSWYTPEPIIWVEGEPIPTELVYPLSGKINDYIYVLTLQTNYNYNYRYDTNNNTWETKTSSNEIKSEACSLSVVNDKIYCVGGTTQSTLCYDPSTDTWSTKTNITTPRLNMTVENVGNIIYCISGYINSTSTYTATHECYDVLTDTWTSKSGISGRAETGSGVVGSNIYVFGGWNGTKVVNTNECYNTLTDTWSVKTVMPSECRQFTASEIDDNIYCMVGTTNYCYNVSNNNWSEKTSVPTNAIDTTSVSIGNKIYCFGGRVYSGSNYSYSSRNECYIANNDN